MTLLFGFLLAMGIALAAYWKKSLSRSGAIAALLMGTIIFGLGGFPWAILLLVFFLSSSLLSRWKKTHKLQFEEKFSKTAERDAAQVFANGGLAMILVLINHLQPENNWIWLAFAASLAAANADTWATELGVLSKTNPRLITTGKQSEPGTSGAISWMGGLASTAGAAAIALPAVCLWQGTLPAVGFLGNGLIFILLTLSGLAASLADSLIGASIQAIFYCPKCQKETERYPIHSCETATLPLRGWRWLNNDWVNGLATASGVLTALLLATILSASGLFAINGKLNQRYISLTSPAFLNGEPIPIAHTCQGEDQAVELQWADLPVNTQAVLILMQDTDTPIGRITHWLATASLQDSAPASTNTVRWTTGENFAANGSYAGPCPPADPPHRYYFYLYALKQPLAVEEGFSWHDAVQKMHEQVTGQGLLMGTYQSQ
jgi:uncharacterized protein (TIGR00297 family)/Raf kinase inhibitor-like YbhB/YbcL family protein